MARLFGRDFTKRELLARVGDVAQVAGAESFTYNDGVRDGVNAVRVRSGGGLDYTVLPGRGMDIAHASYNGIPFAWVSSTGMAHPNRLEPEGKGWLRTFHGGLLTGCGLSNAGAPTIDGDEAMGLHGHLSHIPAEATTADTIWDGDNANVVVSGTMREARVFSENLHLKRTITTPLGGKSLTITDTVENLGPRTSPLMLLYHINFGWPLVSEHTDIVYAPAAPIQPRDAVAEAGIHDWMHLNVPTPDYSEQCFFHEPVADKHGNATVLMVNKATHFGVQITYDKVAFPYLTQWKMMGQSEYVCGIEPANCRVMGRAAEREAGRLQYIEPGESRKFQATITVLEGAADIAGAEAVVNLLSSAS